EARFSLPLFPEQASTLAPRVGALLFFLLAVSTFFTLLIVGCIVAGRLRPLCQGSPDHVARAELGQEGRARQHEDAALAETSAAQENTARLRDHVPSAERAERRG